MLYIIWWKKQKDISKILGSSEDVKSTARQITTCYGNVEGYGELVFKVRKDSSFRLNYWKEPYWPAVNKDIAVTGVSYLSIPNNETEVSAE